MHIAFDAREIERKPSGVGIHLINILNRLLRDGHEVVLITQYDELFWEIPSQFSKQVTHVSIDKPRFKNVELGKIVWEEEVIPTVLEQTKPDLYHAVENDGIPDTSIPSIVTVHDVIPLILPKNQTDYFCRYLAYGLAVHRAKKIICVSQNSQKDVSKYFPEAKDKSQVIYNGAEKLKMDGENPFKEHAPYLIYFGGFDARKNIDLLVRAFVKIRQSHPDFRLLIIGEKLDNPYRHAVEKLVQDLKIEESVVFTGYISHEQLGAILKDAFCSVYPSKYEGFGLPPVESMAAGCPAIVANNSSLPEIVGDAGILVETDSEEAIGEAVEKLFQDPPLRQQLIEAGYAQAKKFDWETTYQQVLKVYEEVVSSSHAKRS
ncbi:MAG: glycosyltransferase family 1 protein [Patescibacteria group bacterium]